MSLYKIIYIYIYIYIYISMRCAYIYIYIYISMRCAPTPPQCPLPSILIAVCVPMSSYCDF